MAYGLRRRAVFYFCYSFPRLREFSLSNKGAGSRFIASFSRLGSATTEFNLTSPPKIGPVVVREFCRAEGPEGILSDESETTHSRSDHCEAASN